MNPHLIGALIFSTLCAVGVPRGALAQDRAAPEGVLFQVSTSNAIVVGNYDGEVSAGQIKQHGDFGIAAADALGGEMMLVDGIWYRLLPDGSMQVPEDSLTVPFGMATFFKPVLSFTVGPVKNYQELRAEVDKHLPSRNIFYAVRIEGTFTSVKNRTFERQAKPYRNQAAVTDEQKIFEIKDTEGTFVGFWFPDYISGVNLPGLHLHYLSKDKLHGGHTLDIAIAAAKVSIQPLYGYQIALQHAPDFLKADLRADRTKDIMKVQGR
ncbi:MAG: acetolactate decarboxylase [Rhodomicrobium sp.]